MPRMNGGKKGRGAKKGLKKKVRGGQLKPRIELTLTEYTLPPGQGCTPLGPDIIILYFPPPGGPCR